MNGNGEELKRKIIEILKRHPEGLTILDLSRILGVHRQTVSKYVSFLEGAGTVHKREIGSAKLHYLKQQENLKERLMIGE